MDSLLNSTTCEEELAPVFLKIFHKIQREVTLMNSFHEPSINLIPKLDKVVIKKKIDHFSNKIEAN
jgi:hypothetical protein